MYAKGGQYRPEEFKMLRKRSEPKLEEGWRSRWRGA